MREIREGFVVMLEPMILPFWLLKESWHDKQLTAFLLSFVCSALYLTIAALAIYGGYKLLGY